MENKLRLVVACDHAGYELKEEIFNMLKQAGYQVVDLGTNSTDSVDYPDFVHPLAESIEKSENDYGILICGSGNGVAMTANKYQKVRAAICWNEEITTLARQHNNANVIALPARFIAPELAKKMVNIFLSTEFEGGRHANRVNKIAVSTYK